MEKKKNWFAIPYAFYDNDKFEKLTIEAIIVYGYALDRQGLSIKKGWKLENGDPFVFFTIGEIMRVCKCANQKAHKIKQELVEVGLWVVTKQAKNKPDMIHVVPLIKVGNNEIASPEERIEPRRVPLEIKRQHQEDIARDEATVKAVKEAAGVKVKGYNLPDVVINAWNRTGQALKDSTKKILLDHIEKHDKEFVAELIDYIRVNEVWGEVGVGHYINQMKDNNLLSKVREKVDKEKQQKERHNDLVDKVEVVVLPDYDEEYKKNQQSKKLELEKKQVIPFQELFGHVDNL